MTKKTWVTKVATRALNKMEPPTEGRSGRGGKGQLPDPVDPSEVQGVVDGLVDLLLHPGRGIPAGGRVKKLTGLVLRLIHQIERALAFDCHAAHGDRCRICPNPMIRSRQIAEVFVDELPSIRRILDKDIEAAFEGDPAAKSPVEVVMSYPGFFAVTVHRIAHVLYREKVPLMPRLMSEYAHSRTGIDIHPGATIGWGFFIDHGTGVVIGETCVIGNRVKLYQGVTLGALSFEKDSSGHLVKGIKRHPNVGDGVVIYAGATILGGETNIGAGSIIGGNVWLTHSVSPQSRVYNRQPHPEVLIESGPTSRRGSGRNRRRAK